MFWKIQFLFLINVAFVSKIIYGNPFSNNPLECKDMMPRGINVAPQSGPGPYYFEISHSMYDFQGELHGKYQTQSWNTTMSSFTSFQLSLHEAKF